MICRSWRPRFPSWFFGKVVGSRIYAHNLAERRPARPALHLPRSSLSALAAAWRTSWFESFSAAVSLALLPIAPLAERNAGSGADVRVGVLEGGFNRGERLRILRAGQELERGAARVAAGARESDGLHRHFDVQPHQQHQHLPTDVGVRVM